MTDELLRLRSWTDQRLRNGLVPDHSWAKHVTLLEAIDAILHDMSLDSAMPATQRGRHLQVVRSDRKSALRAEPAPLAARIAGHRAH